MKNSTETIVESPETETIVAVAKTRPVRKPRAAKVAKVEKPTLPLYKNTIQVSGKAGSKTITGMGTIADLAKKLGSKDIPPVHGAVKVMMLTGQATVVKTVSAPKPARGRTAAVFNFKVKA